MQTGVDLEKFVWRIRFFQGSCQKVVIADSCPAIAERSIRRRRNRSGDRRGHASVFPPTPCRIYFDFTGYSDMAIGLGSMLGFDFPENFRRPYSAVSITDFWRRWHITLSNWFRDYLYIPLGGSRGSSARTLANLWVVFVLTGIWHGANWTFLLWGIYHGAWLVAERLTGQRPVGDGATWAPLRRAIVLLAVMVGWVLFRSPDAGSAVDYLGAMFRAGGVMPEAITDAIDTRALVAMGVGVASVLIPAISLRPARHCCSTDS